MSFPSNSLDSFNTDQLSILLTWVASAQPVHSTQPVHTEPASAASLVPVSSATTSQPLVGQYFDQDFIGSSGELLNNFVESGQIWALLIGIVLGYLVRGLTAY